MTLDKKGDQTILFMIINGENLSALAYGVKEMSGRDYINIQNAVYKNQILKFGLINYIRTKEGKSIIKNSRHR